MKKEGKKERKKTPYEKPVLKKFRKLTDVTAQGPIGSSSVPLGCTRF